MRRKILPKSLLLLFYAFAINTVNAQVILSENFEGSFPPTNWTLLNVGTGNNWVRDINNPQSGVYSMACFRGGSNAWAITPALNITTGFVYRISYWYKVNYASFHKFKITIGNAATIASQNTIIHTYNSVGNVDYIEGVDYYEPQTSGSRYVAFNCYSESQYYGNALEIDSIVITRIPICTGMPSVGVSIVAGSTICGGDSSLLKLNGNYNQYGLSYQWQSAPLNSNNFTNIQNATDTVIKVSPLLSTDYRCVVTCTNSGQQLNTNSVAVNINTGCYCTLAPVDCQYGFISNVKFAGINNNSSCSNQGFNYYSSLAAATIYPSTRVPIHVTVSPGAVKFVGVWIDFDRNGRFDSTEFTNLGGSTGLITNYILVPANALGTTRMRVRVKYYGPLNKNDACLSFTDIPETEEYNVTISPLSACTITPAGGNTTGSPSSICAQINFSLQVTGSSISGVAPSYQWQSSSDNSSFTDITGAVDSTLTTQQSVATYYRRKIICNNSLFSYSTSFFKAITPFGNCYCTPVISGCGGITITNIKFGSINNTSSCTLYANYGSTITAPTITAGTFVPLTVSFTALANIWGTGYVKAWFDFNQNGIFENQESYNIATSGANSTQTFLVRIPFDALGGLTKMRVRIEDNGFDMDPCVARTSGETEDYNINIIPSTTPNAKFSVHVNSIAVGANNGSTWANALTTLAQGFAIVRAGDTLKVAKGNYTNGYLLTSGVSYLGGYPNTGNPTNSDRNFALNKTVIKGQEMFGYQLNSNTILNGFIIDSLASFAGFKAAIRLENSNPFITNCVFKNNNFRVLYLYNSNPIISNCFFVNNTDDYVNKGQIEVTNNSTAKIINCVFNKNASRTIINVKNSLLSVKNCTFLNNKMLYNGFSPTLPQAEIIASNNSTIKVANSIFSDNWPNANGFIYSKLTDSSNLNLDSTSNYTLTNCITNYNQAGTNIIKIKDAKFKDSANVAGADNLYFTDDDGLQLMNPCSPAMNAGLNSEAESITDLIGNARIISSTIDIGAYEVQSTPAPIPSAIYVNALASGNNDGTSWQNAFTNLQKAFALCSDTIKVASGSYTPSTNDIQEFFEMQNRRIILGGYPNTGNPSNFARNPVLNPTILSGSLPSASLRSTNIVQAYLVDSTSVLDGFIIQGAANGAIYLTYKGSPTIKNCVVSNNITGIIVNKLSKPFLLKCNFKQNQANALSVDNATPTIDSCSFIKNTLGSAILNTNRSLTIIKNSNFLGNSATNGGDMYNDNSDPQIINCTSDSAISNGFGGSITNFNNSQPIFIKCVFTNSKSPSYASITGGGICYNNNSKPYFSSCSFINSKGVGGAFSNTGSVVKLENCIGYGNSPVSLSSRDRGASFMQNNASTVDIINCSIVKNYWGDAAIINGNNSILNVKNTLLWGNNFNYTGDSYYNIIINTYETDIINAPSAATNISNSITRKYGANGINGNKVGIDPRFININNPAGLDGLYGTADDGLLLCSCSPAINTAIASVNNTSNTDITGNPRLYNSILDMGAYEYQSAITTTSNTSYVNSNSTGLNDGMSWQSAYSNLHSAIKNTCADTIKIMEGSYKPSINSRDSSFVLDRKILLLGGYQNTVSPSELTRNVDNFPTILTGNIGNVNDTIDNSFTIVTVNNTDTLVKIDGITFKDCFNDNRNGNGNSILPGGAVLCYNNKNFEISNCRFTKNYSEYRSNCLRTYTTNLTMKNNVFSKNYSVGGWVFECAGGLIQNCVFANNYSFEGSTVVAGGLSDFKNCMFYNNYAGGGGAGVSNGGSATFINCNFIENKGIANKPGAGVRNFGRAFLLNCIFSGNYTGNGIYADWYDYRGAPNGENNYYTNLNTFNIENSVLQTGFPSLNQNFLSTPGLEKFVNISNPIGPDNRWFTKDDGLKLLSCSPLIDTGAIRTGQVLESTYLVMPTTDILDSQRVVGSRIDVGAYEYPAYFAPVVNINSTDSIICLGTSVTFTAAITGGGTNPSYKWQVNGVNAGTNNSVFTSSTLQKNDKVKVIVTSNEPCVTSNGATSNVITITASSALTASVNITSATSTICSGTSVTLTATPTSGGPTPTYQWKVNGINAGTNSPTFTTSSLQNNDQVTVVMTSSLACAAPATATSNAITMAVTASPIANAGNDVSICAGSSTQLTGSGGASYLWTPPTGLSNANIANPIATPSSSTWYVLTVSNGSCTSFDTVRVIVQQPAAPTVSINTPSNNICSGSNATFTAVALNAGTNPSYQWQVNGINAGANSATFSSSSLQNNALVKVIVTSSGCTTTSVVTSNVITMSVSTLAQPIVSINTNVLTVTNADAAAVYTWQVLASTIWNNVIPTATGGTYTITQPGEYRVKAEKAECTLYSASLVSARANTFDSTLYYIYLSPNPTQGVITVSKIVPSQNWQSIEVINLQGAAVLPSIDIRGLRTVSINVLTLAPGIYFIRLTNDTGKKLTYRFIKE